MRVLRSGQHALITGGSSGLGLALATELAHRGLDVTLLARDIDRLAEARDATCAVVDEVTSAGQRMRLTWLTQRIAPKLLRRFVRRQVTSVYQGPA